MTPVEKAQQMIEEQWQHELPLAHVAREAGLSPFHLQRLFKEQTGESPRAYQQRLRLETAAHVLQMHPDRPVLNVALDCGYSSGAVFARAFQRHFGQSATHYRARPLPDGTGAPRPVPAPPWSMAEAALLAAVRIETRPARTLVYAPTTLASVGHVVGAFAGLASQLTAHEALPPRAGALGLFYDFPLHTALHQCRYRAALPVVASAHLPGRGQFPKVVIEAGKYAVFPVRGDVATMVRAAMVFYAGWLRPGPYTMHQPFCFEELAAVPASEAAYLAQERAFWVPIQAR